MMEVQMMITDELLMYQIAHKSSCSLAIKARNIDTRI